jgi:hypothetical protein
VLQGIREIQIGFRREGSHFQPVGRCITEEGKSTSSYTDLNVLFLIGLTELNFLSGLHFSNLYKGTTVNIYHLKLLSEWNEILNVTHLKCYLEHTFYLIEQGYAYYWLVKNGIKTVCYDRIGKSSGQAHVSISPTNITKNLSLFFFPTCTRYKY